MTDDRFEVQRTIAADAPTIFGVLCDPLGHVTIDIMKFVPDREIAWTVIGQIQPPLRHIYGYTLEPSDDGTLVTSYYDWSEIDPVWKEAGIFPIMSEAALRATLGILARTVRGGTATSS